MQSSRLTSAIHLPRGQVDFEICLPSSKFTVPPHNAFTINFSLKTKLWEIPNSTMNSDDTEKKKQLKSLNTWNKSYKTLLLLKNIFIKSFGVLFQKFVIGGDQLYWQRTWSTCTVFHQINMPGVEAQKNPNTCLISMKLTNRTFEYLTFKS